MKILSIGNSFSCDAHSYLYRISHAEKNDFTAVNLSIGGCTLERHYRNMLGDSRDYSLLVGGLSTGFNMSIKEALLSRAWDVITIQQGSPRSFDYDSYMPYLEDLVAYFRHMCPHAKIYLQETWGYETGSARIERMGFRTMEEMSERVFAAYAKAAEIVKADGIIPSGHGMLALNRAQDAPVHRDTFHAGLGAPRYMLGCIWYETLTGKPVTCTDYSDFDVEVSPEEAALAREIAHKTVVDFVETQRS